MCFVGYCVILVTIANLQAHRLVRGLYLLPPALQNTSFLRYLLSIQYTLITAHKPFKPDMFANKNC
jgi:hypothetical protein